MALITSSDTSGGEASLRGLFGRFLLGGLFSNRLLGRSLFRGGLLWRRLLGRRFAGRLFLRRALGRLVSEHRQGLVEADFFYAHALAQRNVRVAVGDVRAVAAVEYLHRLLRRGRRFLEGSQRFLLGRGAAAAGLGLGEQEHRLIERYVERRNVG